MPNVINTIWCFHMDTKERTEATDDVQNSIQNTHGLSELQRGFSRKMKCMN